MPTENRSCNTEMVSVQATIEALEEAYAGDGALEFMNDAAQLLRQFQAQPAQHQGEPVALPERKGRHLRYDTLMPAFWKGWNACLDEIAKLGPLYTHPAPAVNGEPVATLYTAIEKGFSDFACLGALDGGPFYKMTPLYPHADPAEVERLRNCLRTEIEAGDSWKKEAQDLRAQLAERDTRPGQGEDRSGATVLLSDHRRGISAYSEHIELLKSQLAKQGSLLARAYDLEGIDGDWLDAYHALSSSAERNQCDGCQAGIPLVNGTHRMGKPGQYADTMSCQAGRYASAEPSAPKCGNCESATAQACNDKGCGYLEAGNGVPVEGDERDERADFEEWAKAQGLSVTRTPNPLCFANGTRRAAGDYIDLASLCSFAAWQARAALERNSSSGQGSSEPIAWHVGGNGYDRVCFEHPGDITGDPCVQPINDLRQLIGILKRYSLTAE